MEKIHIELDLTPLELEYLNAAAMELFHKIKSSFEDTTYGALITEDRVLTARDVWSMIQSHVNTLPV